MKTKLTRVAAMITGLHNMALLIITTLEKFAEGGWITVAITGVIIAVCFAILGALFLRIVANPVIVRFLLPERLTRASQQTVRRPRSRPLERLQ